MYRLSPFVWQHRDGYEILLRAVNHDDDPAKKIARIYHGVSDDGLSFMMDDEPDIPPGPNADDKDGCEDPTVALDGERLYVYYTGWNQAAKTGHLMLAIGPTACELQKAGVVLGSTPTHTNPKEATIAQRPDGSWALFFEYARDGRSRLGVASSQSVAGPWAVDPDPLEARETGWDSWHLSPGPLVPFDTGAVMFYNGGTGKPAWRIGWVAFDGDLRSVMRRGAEPVIVPPPPKGDATDIAFAASAINRGDETWLYYSVADKEMRRITLQRATPVA